MASGFFKGVKEGIKDITDGTADLERKEKQEEKQGNQLKAEIDRAKEEVEDLLGSNEGVLYAFTFFNNKMIITDKKLIYVDARVAKSKTYAMVPFNKITSYSLLKPTGLSLKGRLKIFTGGDVPSLELESMFDDGMKEFCKILADKI